MPLTPTAQKNAVKVIVADAIKLNAPNAAAIAVINLTEIQAAATLILTLVSIISTILITAHKLRQPKG